MDGQVSQNIPVERKGPHPTEPHAELSTDACSRLLHSSLKHSDRPGIVTKAGPISRTIRNWISNKSNTQSRPSFLAPRNRSYW